MASTLTNLGYNATKKVYRSVTASMPDTSNIARRMVTNKLHSMITLNWTNMYENVSSAVIQPSDEDKNLDSDMGQEFTSNDRKNSRKRTISKSSFLKAKGMMWIEPITNFVKSVWEKTSNKDRSTMMLLFFALVIGASLFSLIVIGILFAIVQVAVIMTVVGSIAIIVGCVVLVALVVAAGLFYHMASQH